jgi:hypothetical protein
MDPPVSGYAAVRDREQARIHELRLDEFIRRYPRPARVLFLFPGGMGSELWRARAAGTGNAWARQLPHQAHDFDRIWLDRGSFTGRALLLRMQRNGDGAYHDLDDRIVIADGLVKIAGRTLYDRFTGWCDEQGLALFVFAWDWRRRLEDSVALFLAFLPRFRRRVGDAWGVDPLRGFVLLGHSYGGTVAKLLLDEPSAELDEMARAVAVACPFYGFGTVIKRWFEGDRYLNLLGRRRVIGTIASLPGCYPLAYLDKDTWLDNVRALINDPFPLASYPSQDTSGRAVDPYRPEPGRYHAGIDLYELMHGGEIARRIAALPVRRADKLFCIRGAGFDTIGAITWGTSITPRPPRVPGDGIQPAWGTRLAALPADQCITLTDADHMFFLEHRETQRVLARLLPCCVD